MLTGTAGWDTLVGGAGNDTIDGLAGGDSITGGFGNDSIDGGDEADPMMPWAGDSIDGGSGNDTILGGAGNDWIQGGVGNDSLAGESGNDQLQGGLGNDTLLGGDGDDSIRGDRGLDLVDGGAGTDTLSLNGMLADYVVGRPSGTQIVLTHVGNGDSLSASNVENFQFYDGVKTLADFPVISATPSADSLVGTAGNDWIDGLAGNDTLTGLAGNDTLIGGTGIDSLIGGLGDDVYGVDVAGDVIVEAVGAGIDRVNVAFTAAGTYTLSANVEHATITTATAGVNLTGNGENNCSHRQRHCQYPDRRCRQRQSDSAARATTRWSAAPVTTATSSTRRLMSSPRMPNEGTDQVNVALAGGWHLHRGGQRRICRNWQCHGRRYLTGNALNNYLVGNATANILNGGAGNDTLLGGAGNDTLLGGAGSDFLKGGAGNDSIDGGVITDRINYTDSNIVSYDDASGDVTINLSGITGDGSTGSGTASGAGGHGHPDQHQLHPGLRLNDTITGSSALIFERSKAAGNDSWMAAPSPTHSTGQRQPGFLPERHGRG